MRGRLCRGLVLALDQAPHQRGDGAVRSGPEAAQSAPDQSGCGRARDCRKREVPLNASARRALRTYLEPRGALPLEVSLFLSAHGGPITMHSMQNLIAQRTPSGQNHLRPRLATYALAYLRAALPAQNPGKLVELASLLGYESLDTTALYTRPSIDDLAEDLERSRLNVYGLRGLGQSVILTLQQHRNPVVFSEDPTDEKLAWDWTLVEANKIEVLQCRTDHHRLSFAIQLYVLRTQG